MTQEGYQIAYQELVQAYDSLKAVALSAYLSHRLSRNEYGDRIAEIDVEASEALRDLDEKLSRAKAKETA